MTTNITADTTSDGSKPTPSTRGHLTLRGRQSIRDGWDARAGALQHELGELVNIPDIALLPSFDRNVVELRKPLAGTPTENDRLAVERNLAELGYTTSAYFEALRDYLREQGFKDDEMLQEGFREVVTAKAVGLRIVEKLEEGRWNEVVIEDGVLWMQCELEGWGTKSGQIADRLMGML